MLDIKITEQLQIQMNFYKFWKHITNRNPQVFQTPFMAASVLQNGLGMNAEGCLGTILIVKHK